jgi:hypothetical protein
MEHVSPILRLIAESLDPRITEAKPGFVWIQVGLGIGFWLPERAYTIAKGLANQTGKPQFVGLDRNGAAIHSTSRDALRLDPKATGEIAWIFPDSFSG